MRDSVSSTDSGVDPVHLALGLAAARAAAGVALIVAPRRLGGGASTVMARARGSRDLALALHQVWALDRPADLPRTHRLQSLVAAADGAGSLVGRAGVASLALSVLETAGHVAMAKRWERDPQVEAARS